MKKATAYITLSAFAIASVAGVVAIANSRQVEKKGAYQEVYSNTLSLALNQDTQLDKRQSKAFKQAWEDCDQDYMWFGRERGTNLCRWILLRDY